MLKSEHKEVTTIYFNRYSIIKVEIKSNGRISIPSVLLKSHEIKRNDTIKILIQKDEEGSYEPYPITVHDTKRITIPSHVMKSTKLESGDFIYVLIPLRDEINIII